MEAKKKKDLQLLHNEDSNDILRQYTTGRPPKYSSRNALQTQILKYFTYCNDNEKKPTVPGLAYYLGFESRQTLWKYGNIPEFGDTIKRARLYIENERAELLLKGSGNVAGVIFDLKNNFGYADKQEVDTKHTIKIIISDSAAKTEKALEISHDSE